MKACLQVQPEFCSREKLLHCFKRQQNEKPTSDYSSLFFSIPMSLLYSGCSIYFCNWKGIVIHLPFIAVPLPPAMTDFFFLVWPALYHLCLQFLQVFILICCCLYVYYWWHTGIFTDVLIAFMFTLIPTILQISVFCMVVTGQPFSDVQAWARLIYDAHHVLEYSWHNVLQPLGQCGHILAEYCH